MSVRSKIAAWFWAGVAGWVLGALVVLAAFWENAGDEDWLAAGALLVLGGWSATMVGVIAKGVELGVRAANDE